MTLFRTGAKYRHHVIFFLDYHAKFTIFLNSNLEISQNITLTSLVLAEQRPCSV